MDIEKEILTLSSSNVFTEALKEWNLIYTTVKRGKCICGHSIKRICIFKNTTNDNIISVGNTCYKKLTGISFNSFFDVKNIIRKFYHTTLLKYLKDNDVINEYEFDFINRLPTYKTLSKKQVEIFFDTHEKIFKFLYPIDKHLPSITK